MIYLNHSLLDSKIGSPGSGHGGVLIEHVDPDKTHRCIVQVVIVDTQLREVVIAGKLVLTLPCLLNKSV